MSTPLRTLLSAPLPHDYGALAAAARALTSSGSIAGWTSADTTSLAAAVRLPGPCPDDARFPLVSALKFVATQPQCNGPLYSSEGFRIVATLARIIAPETGPALEEDDAAAIEAQKIVGNLFLLNRQLTMTIFLFEKATPGLLVLAKSSTTSLASIFVIYRILFLLTASPDAIQVVVDSGVEYFGPLVSRILAMPEGLPPFTRASVLGEVLKSMFNLQSFTSPENAAVDDSGMPHSDVFAALPHLRSVADTLHTWPMPATVVSPTSHAVHVLMCGGHGWCEPRDALVLCALLASEVTGIFTANADDDSAVASEGARVDDRLPPLMHLLARVYSGSPHESQEAAVIREAIAPADMNRDAKDLEATSAPHALIKLLTSAEFPATRAATELLLFSVCDKDATKMVVHTGLGPAAGFLVNRGLLTPDVLRGAGAHAPDGVNPITGQKDADDDQEDPRAAWEKLTDEEKEAEAEKLFVTFERLNKLGVIKAVDPTTGQDFARPRQ
ncbi:guanine nucleotide exchange factor synembryn-domain-containing protein [Blastocladiella britannica]|nr:guanine nucleotide exchange factor synembryn-domain-containing protein [Blastocladiella britannica]